MELSALELLKEAVQSGASDLFIVTGLPASVRLNGKIEQIGSDALKPADTDGLLTQIYELANHRNMDGLQDRKSTRLNSSHFQGYQISRMPSYA